MSKPARELSKKTSDAHSPAPKLSKVSGSAKEEDIVQGGSGVAQASGHPTTVSGAMEMLRAEMAAARLTSKSDMVEMKEMMKKYEENMGTMQDAVDRAFEPLAAAVEQHDVAIKEQADIVSRLEATSAAQEEAIAELRKEVEALKKTQQVTHETVCDVRKELALPATAPISVPSGPTSGWDRAIEPHILQANSDVVFNGEELVAALAPLLEAANLTLDDVHVRPPQGMTVARRWTLEMQGRDKRTAARKAAQLLSALRVDGSWRAVQVQGPDNTKGDLYIAMDKNPRMIRTEMSGKKLVAELKRRHPQKSWRLLKSEGIVCAGYQQVVKVVAESSSDIRLEYNQKALDDQGIQRETIQESWEAVAELISVRWSS